MSVPTAATILVRLGVGDSNRGNGKECRVSDIWVELELRVYLGGSTSVDTRVVGYCSVLRLLP